MTYLDSNFNFVAMPSQVVDDLWHAFILCTRDYAQFCQLAFGRFLHHKPAVMMDPAQKKMNEGLRRCWWHACKIEKIDPANASRMPRLFALDASLNIANGFYYVIKPVAPLKLKKGQHMAFSVAAVALAILPVAAFADRKIDGTLAGFGPKQESGCGGGCGSDDFASGFGGGCGGGGDGGCGDGGGCGGCGGGD